MQKKTFYTELAYVVGIVVLSFVLHRFKRAYLFSFVTALFYGFVLDGIMGLIAGVALEGIALRVVFYAMGLVICSAAINLLFNTYLPPEAYEVFVKEISDKTGVPISKTKTAYDVTSCTIAW